MDNRRRPRQPDCRSCAGEPYQTWCRGRESNCRGIHAGNSSLSKNAGATSTRVARPWSHGFKETLFRFGEALALAGFDCYAVDLPGHGESRLRFSGAEIVLQMGHIARALGPVDVFIGHSMGAGAGQASVRNGHLNPKLFIAAGASPDLGEHAPPLLLLAGYFEELIPLSRLKERTDARLVVSPWSDHALEVWDPVLVNAGVEAACGAVGKPRPPTPRFWLVRLAGVVFGVTGALGLIWSLPKLSPRLAGARRIFVPAVMIITISIIMNKWVGSTLNVHRIPLQVAIGLLFWLAFAGLSKFGLPRWTMVATPIVSRCSVLLHKRSLPLFPEIGESPGAFCLSLERSALCS